MKQQRIDFAKNILESRVAQGKTQLDCAVECDVSLTAYQHWERGVSLPKRDNMKTLCDYLGIGYYTGEVKDGSDYAR